MSMEDVQKQISDVLTNAFKRDFWLNIQDSLATGYEAVHSVVVGNVMKLERPEQVRFRPQARHYGLNAAFRRAAVSAGYEVFDAETKPKGENYIIVSSNGVKVSRIGINHDESMIRTAKHRSLIAELNADYEGYTPDFFNVSNKSEYSKSFGSLGVLVLNVNPPLSLDQDRMLDIRVVVPFTNMKGFHYNHSITDVLELYNVERNVIVPDMAIPLLKKRLKDQEG